MTFPKYLPDPGTGGTYEFDDFWEDVPLFSPELEAEMARLREIAVELNGWLNGDLVA